MPRQNIHELNVLPIALNAAGGKMLQLGKYMSSQARGSLVGRKRSSQVVCPGARHFRGEREIHGVTWNGKNKLQEGSICKVMVATGYVQTQDTPGM